MPRHLLSVDPAADPFPSERLAYLERCSELLADYAFFGDRQRYAALAEQLDTETSKYERGFICGYVHAILVGERAA